MGAVAAVLSLVAIATPAGHDVSERLGKGGVEAAIFREGRIGVAPTEVDLEEPVVEGVNLPDARVYHMNDEGLSVVMVVDESFDI
jgi:hypothetical protein